eukprot:Rhum_TRINITY_DN14095_c6_g1::Rhum_TRINITY_DN14095_c6_g1_i2::g.68887::m.68887
MGHITITPEDDGDVNDACFGALTESVRSPLGISLLSPDADDSLDAKMLIRSPPTKREVVKQELDGLDLSNLGSPRFSVSDTPLSTMTDTSLFASPKRLRRGSTRRLQSSASLRRNNGRYRKGRKLGEGSCGIVYAGIDQLSGAFIAIKEIKARSEQSAVEELKREFNTLLPLRHPNIVRYYDYELTFSRLTLYMELVEGGSLLALMQQFKQLSEGVLKSYFRQVVAGLVYLHAHGVVHRDLKPANMLVASRTSTVKLADFGSAAKVGDHGGGNTGFAGTVMYAAPEALRGKYIEKSDIWSIGVSMCELLRGSDPWADVLVYESELELMLKIGTRDDAIPAVPKQISADFRAFIVWCLHRDPAERPDAAQLSEHTFLAKTVDFTPAQIAHMCYPRMESIISIGSVESADLDQIMDDLDYDSPVKKSASPTSGFGLRNVMGIAEDDDFNMDEEDFYVSGGLYIAGCERSTDEADENDDEVPLMLDKSSQGLGSMLSLPPPTTATVGAAARTPTTVTTTTVTSSTSQASSSAVSPGSSAHLTPMPSYWTNQVISEEAASCDSAGFTSTAYPCAEIEGTRDGLITVTPPSEAPSTYKFDIFFEKETTQSELFNCIGNPVLNKLFKGVEPTAATPRHPPAPRRGSVHLSPATTSPLALNFSTRSPPLPALFLNARQPGGHDVSAASTSPTESPGSRTGQKRINLVSLSGTGVRLSGEQNMLSFLGQFLKSLFERAAEDSNKPCVYVSSLAATLEKIPFLYDNVNRRLITDLEELASWKRLGRRVRQRCRTYREARELLSMEQLLFSGVSTPYTFVIELYPSDVDESQLTYATPDAPNLPHGTPAPVPDSIMFINLFYGKQGTFWLEGLAKLVQHHYAYSSNPEERPLTSPAVNNPLLSFTEKVFKNSRSLSYILHNVHGRVDVIGETKNSMELLSQATFKTH